MACFDVSPQLDFMVRECREGTKQLWSLHTAKQVWVRPVIVHKNSWTDHAALKKSSSSSVLSYYRSVVFHPEENIVLPGVLSHAYTFNGDLKPLFPASLCNFTVCSISRDRTTMLTNCPEDAKCIIMWSLRNGTEIIRTTRNDDVLSFAWSPDGRLLAISHCTICFVDARDEFRTVAEHSLEHHQVCGMTTFSPDCRSLFCSRQTAGGSVKCYRLDVNIAEHPTCTYHSSGYFARASFEFESRCVAGFLLGDLFSSSDLTFKVKSDSKTLLAGNAYGTFIEMFNIKEERKAVTGCCHSLLGFVNLMRPSAIRDSTPAGIPWIGFSSTGETVFSGDARGVTAWNVSNERRIGRARDRCYLEARMKERFLLSGTNSVIEMWDFEL